MHTSETNSEPALGFLTVVAHPQHGLFGGYLILNPLGRPLEFHCTAPIKSNRAQEILYGPTLEAFLYGEQIGRTLLKHGTHQPVLICTDRPAALCVREHIEVPVVLILPPEEPADPPALPRDREKHFRLDAAHTQGPHLIHFSCGRNRLAVPADAEADRRGIIERWGRWAESFDLAEPFGRIREAIAEAQQAVP